jgi:hypothetical protein
LASCDHPHLDVAGAALAQTQQLPRRDAAERLAGPAADLDFHALADRRRTKREADPDPLEVPAATPRGLDLRPEPAQVVAEGLAERSQFSSLCGDNCELRPRR